MFSLPDFSLRDENRKVHQFTQSHLIIYQIYAEPQTEKEIIIYKEASEVLNKATELLDEFKEYVGCGELIRKAISEPNEDNELAVWEAVIPLVEQQYYYYQFYEQIRILSETLLREICKGETKETSISISFTTGTCEAFCSFIRFCC
ncbi:hypothetical protein M0813_14640 [Anaeramoeba flamelloides]|uniref:CYRIA/CYRIB Rac1 binding domain-containing protein n=1 Tax=Anaeramoeba flamelloides TaxID=1746091 RepID=A0ABQ8Z5B9_9EUKA|nr:hypothetical protein M0813_14640 [Anaeramoeba flamelloides]